jgi:hypothetical protein
MENQRNNRNKRNQRNHRIAVSLSDAAREIFDDALCDASGPSDAMSRLVLLAGRADVIDRQNRELAEAMVEAMKEMAATLAEIRLAVTRLEKGHA